MAGLRATLTESGIRIGPCCISFQRTLRVPEQGSDPYPLPPTFGMFPLVQVGRNPLRIGLPMYQREAMWMAFDSGKTPCAIVIGADGINAVSGERWTPELRRNPQNYIVCPDQPWLDGFTTGEGVVRQFVAMPLGSGYTAGEQLEGTASNQLHIVVYASRAGVSRPPRSKPVKMKSASLGIAAGGQIRQKVYPDRYPEDAWHQDRSGLAEVILLTTGEYRRITKKDPHPTPIDARTYAERGFPWFELYEERESSIAAPDRLAGLKPASEVDAGAGRKDARDESIEIRRENIRRISRRRKPDDRPSH